MRCYKPILVQRTKQTLKSFWNIERSLCDHSAEVKHWLETHLEDVILKPHLSLLCTNYWIRKSLLCILGEGRAGNNDRASVARKYWSLLQDCCEFNCWSQWDTNECEYCCVSLTFCLHFLSAFIRDVHVSGMNCATSQNKRDQKWRARQNQTLGSVQDLLPHFSSCLAHEQWCMCAHRVNSCFHVFVASWECEMNFQLETQK